LTPLISTMKRATDDPAFKSAPGFKTLLVLSDGCNFTKQLTPGQSVPTAAQNMEYAAEFQDAFVNTDRKVSIRMVLFLGGDANAVSADRAAADIQFKDIDKIATPSSKIEAGNSQELTELLAASVRPRVVLYRGNVQVTSTAFIAKRATEAL